MINWPIIKSLFSVKRKINNNQIYIKAMYVWNNKNLKKDFDAEPVKNLKNFKIPNSINFNPQPNYQEDNNLTLCSECGKNPDLVYLDCLHLICANCFLKNAQEDIFHMKCKILSKCNWWIYEKNNFRRTKKDWIRKYSYIQNIWRKRRFLD